MGISRYDKNDRFIKELTTCVKEEVVKIGKKQQLETLVTVREASDSQRQQNNQVTELLDAGCNVLVVNLVDRTDPSAIIEQAKEKDVPVIFFNREPVKEDLAQWDKLYYIGGDAKESGRLQGELAASVIQTQSIDRNEDGKIQYVVLEGEPGHQDAIIRTEEAVKTLKEKGIQLEKLGYGIANWNRAQAENRMIQLIGQHQNNIELVLSNNDEMALGGLDAYAKLNRTESSIPIFLGIDGIAEGLQAVDNGQLAGTVYNDKEDQAKAIATLAAKLVMEPNSSKVQQIYSPYKKITQENVGDYE
ncbi:galactose ABC transporter substrate-binding protein [Enterococcus asini]|uniref:galactose ABC transporter substrate-binding protein n=1 Tax=Enterococcus asini TaxID=57732 RepID=UPI00241EE7BD|nr:galactose ABC transporter substrate-binding protein [Enterococcus asini]